MDVHESMLVEFGEEAKLTRKMLERVPYDNPQWRPHEKSMTMQRLSSHIAEIPFWMMKALYSDGLDFLQSGSMPERFYANSRDELLGKFSSMYEESSKALENAGDDLLNGLWTMRRGDQVIYRMTRVVVIRKWVFDHTIHHRGQLSVYLRLNNIPVPGMYGPSADEKTASG